MVLLAVCSTAANVATSIAAPAVRLELSSRSIIEPIRYISPDTLDPTLPGVGTNRYAYALNDPINKSDPNGNFAVLGAVVGAVVGVGIQAAVDAYNGELSGVGAYAGAAAGGAIAGATAGLLSGAVGVYGTAAVAGAAGNVTAGVTEDAINGNASTVSGVVGDAAVGGAFGLAGGVVGSRISNGINGLSNHPKGKLGEKLTIAKEAVKGNFPGRKNVEVFTGRLTPTGRPQRALIDREFNNAFTRQSKLVDSKLGRWAGPSPNQRVAKRNGGIFEYDKMTPDQVGGAAGGAASGGIAAGANHSSGKEESAP
ncbi:hypothetical protein [Kumtagia ephedrae]|uniref:hypothetical protein n=1 Tax=Kumtagia ephedrae TaxID=2116701 RepID=UPI0010572401|nr:hypothetical protein [Mesorhizobium ephedrae]